MLEPKSKYNDDLASHYIFLGWLLDSKGEHGLDNLPLYLFIKDIIGFKDLMLFEISSVDIIKKDTLIITFILAKDSQKITLELTHKKILITFNNKDKIISYSKISKYISKIYYSIKSYQGKQILRIFYNESKFFKGILYDKSYKGILGKYKIKEKYNIDNFEQFTYEFLNISKELSPISNIINTQLNNKNKIYGSIFNKHSFSIHNYKINFVNQIKPKIISIGSSRCHPFQQSFFTKSFYNMSYTMTFLQEGKLTLEKIFKNFIPEVLIIPIEFWWFNLDHYKECKYLPLHDGKEHFDIDYINKFYEYINDDILPIKNIDLIKQKKNINELNRYEGIGLRGLKDGEGYLSDGYYFYSKQILDHSQYKNNIYNLCKKQIDNNLFHFNGSYHFSDEKYKIFLTIIELCKKNNVTVIPFIAPLENKTYKYIQKSTNHQYIFKLINKLKKDIGCINLLNPKKIKSPKDEFLDCYHGGDITYLRILRYLTKKNSLLTQYINVEEIDKKIRKNKNKVVLSNKLFKVKAL